MPLAWVFMAHKTSISNSSPPIRVSLESRRISAKSRQNLARISAESRHSFSIFLLEISFLDVVASLVLALSN